MYIKLVFISVFFTLFINQTAISQTYNWGHVAIGGGGFVDGIIISKTNPKVMYSRTDVGGAYRWDSINTKWVQMLDWVSQPLVGYLGIESMALDPQNNNKIYLLAGTSYFSNGSTAILRSSDGGKTFLSTDIIDVSNQFKAHGNGMGRQNGEKLVVDPNISSTLYCGTRWNGLFKSTNSGTTWTNVTTTGNATSNGNGISFVVCDPSTGTKGTTASQTVVFGISQTSNNLYISTTGGGLNSFTAITGGPSGLMPQRAVLASDRTLYITYADLEGPWNPTKGALWKYNLATLKWTDITPDKNGYSYGGISVDPNNSNRIIASTINKYLLQYTYNGNNLWGDHFYLSTNGGTSWSDLVTSAITLNSNNCTWMPGNTIHWAGDIQFNPSNTAQAFVVSGNGLFQCDNVNSTASTWKFAGIGIEETVPLDIVSIPNGPLFSVIGDYDGFKHTDIYTYAPVHSPGMGTSTGIAYAAGNTNYLVRVGAKMYYTTNQGTSWTQCGTMNGTKGRVAINYNASIILHCPEGSSTTYRSTNNGTSWTTCNGISIKDAVPVADPVNLNKFYAYNSSNGTMLVSTDGGANFASTGNAGNDGSQLIRTVPGREGHLWIALKSGGLVRSTNSGASYTSLSKVSNCDAVGLGKAAPTASYQTIYIWGTVGGVTGIFRSIDEGANWTRINDDQHQYGGPGNGQFVIGDWNTYGRVYMSTVGLGIVYGDVSTTTSPTVTIATASSSSSFCIGKTATLTATTTVTGGTISKVDFYDGSTLLGTSTASPYTYNWTNATVGSHTVTAKATDNTNAVTTSASISIVVNALPTISAGADVAVCLGKPTTLTATGGTSYVWSNAITTASNTINPTSTTTYTVTGSNATNCSATDAVIVTVNALPTINAGVDISICSGTSATISVTGGISYNWSTGASTSSITVSPTATTSYIVTGTNTANCSSTDNIKITVNDIPSAPTVTTPTNYTLNTSASTLTANGINLLWYNNMTGGIALSATPVPITTVTGTSKYYVSQTINSCESPRSEISVIVTDLKQAIQLTSGWNLISFYLQPSDSSISSVFGGLGTNLETIKTQDEFYAPTQPTFQNSLKSIVRGQAYFVKVKSNSTISISGTLVGSLTIGLKTGWNVIGYPKQINSDIATTTSSIETKINSIKNFNGFYIPTGATNSITSFESGKGYFINTKATTNLTW